MALYHEESTYLLNSSFIVMVSAGHSKPITIFKLTVKSQVVIEL